MSNPTILLLFGGESSEHEVSIASARNVLKAINVSKFTVVLGFIDTSGKWWKRQTIDEQTNEQILPQLGYQSFITQPSGETIAPDVILPILHGKNGEDGTVQGLAQLLHIPIVGCDMTASALCMDKIATKEILIANRVNVVPYAIYRLGDTPVNYSELSEELGASLFVKPARAGSSVGVSKVQKDSQLTAAISEALRHDSSVLIEKAMDIRELEVAVLGNPPNHKASVVGEVIAGADFYSYEAKYDSSSSSRVEIPARVSEQKSQEIRELAEKIYAILGCTGLARIDFFLTETGDVYLNEVNTIPGFTDISMYPKMWEYSGISYSDLIETLINNALLEKS
jgi:D-alanine-D-alanine ligase